jgi:hypothetical protein
MSRNTKRHARNTRVRLTVITAALASITAALYVLAAMIQLVAASCPGRLRRLPPVAMWAARPMPGRPYHRCYDPVPLHG